MRSTTLHHGRRFRLVSYGGGTAYVIERIGTHESILFQGDDADQLYAEFEQLTNGRLPISYDDALNVLWNDYRVAQNSCVSAQSDSSVTPLRSAK